MIARIRLIARVGWQRGRLATALVFAPVMAFIASCGGGGPTSPQPGTSTVATTSADFQALLPPGQQGATNVGTETCGQTGCHGTGPAPSRTLKSPRAATVKVAMRRQDALDDKLTEFKQTAHHQKGISCESCHGPGSNHVAANGDKSKILTFPNILNAAVCGQCHKQEHGDWSASKHDEFVVPVIEEAVDNPAVYGKTCLRCHSGLFRAQILEAGVNPNTLTTDFLGALARQTETQVPYSSVCGTCHDPHSKTGNLTDEGKEVQLRHAASNTNTSQVGPGATIDQYSTFNQACAECHNGRGANPSDSALTSGTARPNMHDSNQFNMLGGFAGVSDGSVISSDAHFNAPGQCIRCHMSSVAGGHSFVPKLEKCAPCHSTSEAAARSTATKADIQSHLLGVRARLQQWAQTNKNDGDLWDYTSMIQALGKTAPNQSTVPIQVKRARHNYYFVIRDKSLGVHNGQYARYLLDVADRQLDAVGVPRLNPIQVGARKQPLIESDRIRANRADLRATRD